MTDLMSVGQMTTTIDALTVVAGVLALLSFLAYSLTFRWWQTRSGTAAWLINFCLVLLAAHFVGEEYEGQVYWRELVLMVFLCSVLLYWLWVVLWKRWRFKPESVPGAEPGYHP